LHDAGRRGQRYQASEDQQTAALRRFYLHSHHGLSPEIALSRYGGTSAKTAVLRSAADGLIITHGGIGIDSA
jgi:hypothetical protein